MLREPGVLSLGDSSIRNRACHPWQEDHDRDIPDQNGGREGPIWRSRTRRRGNGPGTVRRSGCLRRVRGLGGGSFIASDGFVEIVSPLSFARVRLGRASRQKDVSQHLKKNNLAARINIPPNGAVHDQPVRPRL